MSLSETNQKLLAAMDLVENVSRSLKTISWIWGGFVTDICLGRILREHDDLDYLTLNLHSLQSGFVEAFSRLGWQAEDLVNGDLKLRRNDVKIHLGNVEFEETARWTHNGEKGSLLFPISWLSLQTIKFHSLEVHVVAPELQFVLKEHPRLLNLDWTMRERDVRDKEYLKDILIKRNIDIRLLHELVTGV